MRVRVLALLALLTVVATWPQARQLDRIPDNVDAYFSLWRLGWTAHQLPADPGHLFDANIFHPEQNTLAYSDAVLLQGVIALPFIRAGLPVVYAYNGLVLASFVLAGFGMFVLALRLTASPAAALLGAVVFAFTPFRFDHYYHLELLWAAWMPLAFWMVHRTLDGGRLRDGLLAGLFVALQILSSLYYGVFLCSALVFFVVPFLPGRNAVLRRRALAALLAGGVLAVVIVVPYMQPYWRARDALPERNAAEASLFAAGPRHYLAALPENRLAGPVTASLGRPEKRLFPGFVAIGLALLALWPRPTRTVVAYAVVLAVSIDLSFGPRGIGFDWLREHVAVYRGLRAPARFGQVALMALAVLAATGCGRLKAMLDSRGRGNAVAAGLVAIAFCEYLVQPLALERVPTAAPPVYQWLRDQPRGVVAEMPLPTRATMPLHEGTFQFLSTFHWQPVVNGYSGNWTDRYVALLGLVEGFPDDTSIAALEQAGVTYILVHERHYGARFDQVLDGLARNPRVAPAGRFDDGGLAVAAFRLRNPR